MIRWMGIRSLGLLLLVGSCGCSAPHENPLDPASDRYRPPLLRPILPGMCVPRMFRATFPLRIPTH